MTVDRPLREPADVGRAAFLRGIEHRGRVLALAQCGDAARANAALAECKIAFHELAEDAGPEQWTALFWQSLLAHPALRARLVPDPHDPFSQLEPGPRAALLLRLVAELDRDAAAEALGVAPETYRHALARAIEALRAKGIDEAVLHHVRDSLRRETRPTHATPLAADDEPPIHHAWHARRLRPWLYGALGVLALALVASFFWVPGFLRGTDTPSGFQTLREHAPAVKLSAAESAISDSDFDLLVDPQGERIARDLDLYAWYAASAGVSGAGNLNGAPLPETTLPESAAPEADAEDAADAAASGPLPVVSGHPVPASGKAATSGASDAH